MSGISHIARGGTMTIESGLRQRFSTAAPVGRQGVRAMLVGRRHARHNEAGATPATRLMLARHHERFF
jgi:hypothetical protein